MSQPPNHHDENNHYPQSELDVLEAMLNNMFSGTMSMLLKTMQEPTLIEISPSPADRQTTHQIAELDGSDFQRISQKRRQRLIEQGTETSSNDGDGDQAQTTLVSPPSNSTACPTLASPQNSISIFNQDQPVDFFRTGTSLLSTLFSAMEQDIHARHDQANSSHWSFTSTSTSQRSTILPDGTEETVITTNRNGQTETMTRIKFPDGTIQETKQISGPSQTTPSDPTTSPFATPRLPDTNDGQTAPAPGLLSRLVGSLWGKS
ncbi:hypothetical protein DM01DRAFT_1407347 [Hesseltinella vesiculosa]|uniref:Uncharacterized protein n=1 Tax=Hesseltinella vesiculosa TaxID=101127 RepID=A0A1X2GIB1_9FUNG|nr:hypothetical protein DM01DRAFT_1407347 [Hesseltinella vesiculosa]